MITPMKYRPLPHDPNICLSEIGFGAARLDDNYESDELLHAGIEAGVNFLDTLPSVAGGYKALGRVIAPVREQMFLQLHLGCTYASGEYGWTRNLDEIKRDWERQLNVFKTDYADFGFIHCIDTQDDFVSMQKNGLWEYALELKEQGAIRHLGCSTHSVEVAREFAHTGLVDLMMFSLNPMYDYTDESAYGKGTVDERAELYRVCEAASVALSVMKSTAGGQLLDARQSPFKRALTPVQCAQYALDKPAVVSVLAGMKNVDELNSFLRIHTASAEERDYSMLAEVVPSNMQARCVYCSHCHPCPTGLNIALINKYYDLAKMGDEQARGHYEKLELHASDCITCGHCDARCPFSVSQSERMSKIAGFFGV